jgi:hypothetical protein
MLPMSFAGRFARLMADAGWRVALHVVPYAMAAGVIGETALRLRILFLWKLPLLLAVIACLHLAVLLGAHVAALRIAGGRGSVTPPIRHHLAVAGRITGESAVMLLVVILAALALVGALDLAIMALDPGFQARWPWTLVRLVATLAALAVMAVLMVGGTALAASSEGRSIGFVVAARGLLRRSERTAAVICCAIAAGTLVTVLVAFAVKTLGVSPPLVAASLAKAAGFLATTTTLSVGAAAIAGGD